MPSTDSYLRRTLSYVNTEAAATEVSANPSIIDDVEGTVGGTIVC